MLKPRPPTRTGLPRLPASPFQRAVPITPADRTGACVDCFPVRAAFPGLSAGRRPHRLLSRPAQTSLTLRPAGSLDRPRRPLSRGFGPADRSSKPLVSYQINRQLSGWNLPPLVIRAFEAHRMASRKPTESSTRHVMAKVGPRAWPAPSGERPHRPPWRRRSAAARQRRRELSLGKASCGKPRRPQPKRRAPGRTALQGRDR